MSTWAEVSKGDTTELRGKRYVVTKLKVKGKRALVTVEYGKDRFESEVRLSDAVTIVKIKHVATTADKPRNADLIVTLHRTIDAQLALLEGEVRFCGMNGYSPKGHIVELARAINGEPTK